MKAPFNSFCAAFLLLAVFLLFSCHRDTALPDIAGDMHTEIASNAQEAIPEADTSVHELIEIFPPGYSTREQGEVQSPVVLEAEVAARFTPLADNERFAYSMRNQQTRLETGGWVHWQKMTMYAVKNNDITDVTELFTWEPVRFASVQFTGDLRKAFFLENNVVQSGRGTAHAHILYMVNGLTGEIQRLLTDVRDPLLRASRDGRFIAFLSHFFSHERFVDIYLFDIESERIADKFRWQVSARDGTFRLFRFDTIFRIFINFEGGYIGAVSELNPETMEFNVLWDRTNTPPLGRSSLPTTYPGWLDGVGGANPNIRLRR